MGSNRIELILSVADAAEHDLTEGMRNSCERISKDLLKHVQAMANNATATTSISDEAIPINTIIASKDVKRANWDYAMTAQHSIKCHMGFLAVAVEDILEGFRGVLSCHIERLSEERKHGGGGSDFDNRKAFGNRAHTLGGIRPPDPRMVAKIAMARRDLDIETINEALRKIKVENEIFDTEYRTNRRLIVREVQATTASTTTIGVGGVVYAPCTNVCGDDDDDIDDEASASLLTAPAERTVDDGAAWRPPTAEKYGWWWYDFSNIWGDKGLSYRAVMDVIARVVKPKAIMARAIVAVCSHLRNCACVMLRNELYELMEAPYTDPTVWEDMINNKLEWFTIVALILLEMDAEADRFAEFLTSGGEMAKSAPVMLTNMAESIPPWLLSREWSLKNLYAWPGGTRSGSAGSALADMYVICRPGDRHPVLESFVNESARTLRHRISATKVAFIHKILGDFKEENEAGTQWLTKKSRKRPAAAAAAEGEGGGGDAGKFKVFIKNETASSSPLYFDASYRTCFKKARHLDNVRRSMTPLLMGGGGGNNSSSSSKWATLDLRLSMNVEDLTTFWRNVSPESADYSLPEKELADSIDSLSSLLKTNRTKSVEQSKAIDAANAKMTKFLTDMRTCNIDAEKALFLMSLWKKCADRVIGLLSNMCDL